MIERGLRSPAKTAPAKPRKASSKDRAPEAHQNTETSLFPPAWLDDAARFAREGLDLELFPHQAQLCDSNRRINLLIAGRGAGKSEAARVKILQDACLRENHLSLVVSSSQRMSADFGSRLLDLLRDSPTLSPLIASVRADCIALTNGSEIRLLPASPDTIRGFHPRRRGRERGVTLVLDEACFMPNGDEVRKAVEYVLITARQGRLFIVSSPTSVESWVHGFARQANEADSEVAVFHCGSAANPLIPPEEIERLRNAKNDLEFRAEVLGEWVEGAYGLFSGMIEPRPLDALEPLSPGTVYGLGVDLALSFSPNHDRNALAVAAMSPPANPGDEPIYRLIDARILHCASDRELRDTIDRLKRLYPITRAVVEQYQGKALAEYCESLGVETELLAPTAAAQRVAFHRMHQLLREKRLRLPNSLPEDFFTEMRAFQYRRGADGGISFGSPSTTGSHDDSVYAAAWAIRAVESAPSIGVETRVRLLPVWC